MNGLDITILTLIGISVAFGLYRGLVREIFSLLAIIIGFLVAAWYYPLTAAFIQRWLADPTLAGFLGFVITFIGTALVIGLIGRLLRHFLKHAHLDLEDRFLGGVFGFIKGLFVSTVLVMILLAFMPPAHPFVAQSKTIPYFVRLAAVVRAAIPEELKDRVEKNKSGLLEYWKEQNKGAEET
jgi:membrane protein required for colicin V production